MQLNRQAGLIQLDLAEVETNLLAGLFDDFANLLAEPDADDPVLRRLYPDGYADDAEAAAEYRELVRADLHAGRSDRLGQCHAELPYGAGIVELGPEAADRWLRVLNDLRLALGTRLGVTETDELDPTEPAVAIYHWLSAVQDLLVGELMD